MVTEIAAFGALFSSVKSAIDIAKALRDADTSIAKAEYQLKLADMLGSLADAKVEIVEIQELLKQKDDQIKELEEAFQSKDGLVKQFDAYYELDASGKPTGEPHCMACWQIRHKKYHLHHVPSERQNLSCVSCGTIYNQRYAATITPETRVSGSNSQVIVQS